MMYLQSGNKENMDAWSGHEMSSPVSRFLHQGSASLGYYSLPESNLTGDTPCESGDSHSNQTTIFCLIICMHIVQSVAGIQQMLNK